MADNPFTGAYETSLSKIAADDWQFLRAHWMMFGSLSFLSKLGSRWTAREVRGAFRQTPLFCTKRAAERYVSDLLHAEGKWRAHQTWERENQAQAA